MTETVFGKKKIFDINFEFAHVSSTNIEGEGFIVYTRASHQESVQMLHLYYTIYTINGWSFRVDFLNGVAERFSMLQLKKKLGIQM